MDYAKRVFPVRVGIIVFFWTIAVLAGGVGLWMVNRKMPALEELQQQVREDIRGDSVPTQVRSDAMGLLEIQDGMVKIIKGALVMLLGCGVMGIAAEVGSLRLTKRLLAIGAKEAG